MGQAKVTANVATARGQPSPTEMEGRESGTCCATFSETWLPTFE